ncbi:MAG: hypothetical protein AAB606_00380, partial [Patescibacteria group bacterium]
MRLILRNLLLVVLMLTLSGAFSINLACAATSSEPKSFVPESFNVNEYLRANENQKTLVPSANNQN